MAATPPAGRVTGSMEANRRDSMATACDESDCDVSDCDVSDCDSCTEAGLHRLTQALVVDTTQQNVTVNTISPGHIGTKTVTATPKDVPDTPGFCRRSRSAGKASPMRWQGG